MPQYRKSDGALLETAPSPINRGGEGAIFRIPVDSYRVAKIYLPGKADPQRLSKLQAMIVNPALDFRPGKPVNLAWPLDILRDRGGKFAGFVMPLVRMPLADLRTIFNPSARNKKGIAWKWGNSLSVAASLAGAVERVHQSNYVVGDLNADNIFVSQDYSITIVDVDSFQVPRENSSEFYRCTVGKDEYTPPELQGCRFSEVTRERQHDNFALAVLIFQTLMHGKHPFSGVTDVDVPNLTRHCIQKGIFPYATHSPPVRPPPNAPDFDWLPPALGQLFLRAFITGFTDSHRRPSAGEWQKELKQTVKLVRECGHYIHDHARCCPWCEQEHSQSNPGSQAGCAPQQTTPPQAVAATSSVQIQPAIAKPAAGFRLRWIFIVVFGVWIVAKFLPPSPQSPLAPISVAPTAVPRQKVLTSNADGVGKDCGKAFDLISRARDAGSIEDISNLGVLYQRGCGTSKDNKRAFELFLEGAYKGDKYAMRNLADAYVNGLGVKRDIEQAFHWAKESEKLGNSAFQMVVDAQKKR